MVKRRIKTIENVLHNFGHSFVSDMNMEESLRPESETGILFIWRLVLETLKRCGGREQFVDVLSGEVSEELSDIKELSRNIEWQRDRFATLAGYHSIDASEISSLKLQFELAPTGKLLTHVIATDTTGHYFHVKVKETI